MTKHGAAGVADMEEDAGALQPEDEEEWTQEPAAAALSQRGGSTANVAAPPGLVN